MIRTSEELQLALTNEKEYKRLIEDGRDLKWAIEDFPDYANELISPVLTNPEEYKRLITDWLYLRQAISLLPDHAKELIKPLLINPEEYKRLIKNSSDLWILAKENPLYAEELFNPIFTNPEEYKRLIANLPDLCGNIAKEFPQYAEKLIYRVLNDTEEFQRLIKNKHFMEVAANTFPGHDDILGQPTVEEALHVIEMKSAPAKAFTKGAVMGALSETETPFSNPLIAQHLGTFLNRRDGGRVIVDKNARDSAKTEEARKLEQIKRFKK